jgi:hypothetical protein
MKERDADQADLTKEYFQLRSSPVAQYHDLSLLAALIAVPMKRCAF